MKMHLLSGGRLRMRKSVYFPDAERSESVELPVSCALFRHSQGNVLFEGQGRDEDRRDSSERQERSAE